MRRRNLYLRLERASGIRLRQAVVDGEEGKFQAAVHPNFVEDVGEVVLHRVFTEGKAAGNFFVAEPGDDAHQNIHLTLGETVVLLRLVTG